MFREMNTQIWGLQWCQVGRSPAQVTGPGYPEDTPRGEGVGGAVREDVPDGRRCGGEPSSFYEAWGGGHKEADSDHKYLVADQLSTTGVYSRRRGPLWRGEAV